MLTKNEPYNHPNEALTRRKIQVSPSFRQTMRVFKIMSKNTRAFRITVGMSLHS